MNQTWLPSQAPDEGQQCADPEVEAVEDGEADEQSTDQAPPDELECRVVEQKDHAATPVAPPAASS